MWVVDIRFWRAPADASSLERLKLHADAVEEWLERHGDEPGYDPFDDAGAYVLTAAEDAIRRGDRW
jgi:hypothetical protein